MKRKDLVVIISAAIFSSVLALIVSNLFISTDKNSNQEAEFVQPIVADFPQPDKAYFNKDSIDPTQLIRIGQSSNPAPFNGNQ